MYLRELKLADKEKMLDMCKEIYKTDKNFEGLDFLSNLNEDNFEDVLKKIEKYKHKDKINKNYSTETFFVAISDMDKIVGGIIFRHQLKGNLINHGGNLGYLIRPAERKKGYGTEMLHLALVKCREKGLKRVLVSCRNTNLASAKVIENNGGIYENDFYDKELNKVYKRYWINLL